MPENSQSHERFFADATIGASVVRLPTQLHNGYAAEVEHLYAAGDMLGMVCGGADGGLYC